MFKKYLAGVYYLFNKFLFKNAGKAEFGRWFYNEGDKKLLTTHDLSGESIVFDVGGYTGVFSEKIEQKYNPFLFIFEPVEEYFNILKDKFKNNNKVKIFNFGLADETNDVYINIDGEGSSIFGSGSKKEKIKLVDIKEFMTREDIDRIDLISINIEGGEYDLLKRMIDEDLLKQVKTIQVQFHNLVPGAKRRRRSILRELEKNYRILYSYPWVWECFTKKNSNEKKKN